MIIIDQRERTSGIEKELIKRNIEFKIQSLISADYILQTTNKNSEVITLGIERKTKEDFLNSIIDRRLFQQLLALKENFKLSILILEGKENIFSLRNIHPNAIRGALTAIALDYNIPTIETKNISDTASFLETILKRLEQPVKDISLQQKRRTLTSKEQQEFIISSLPSIGPKTSKELLKKFKTIKNIFNASEKELKEINKIGKKKAQELTKIFNEKYKL